MQQWCAQSLHCHSYSLFITSQYYLPFRVWLSWRNNSALREPFCIVKHGQVKEEKYKNKRDKKKKELHVNRVSVKHKTWTCSVCKVCDQSFS